MLRWRVFLMTLMVAGIFWHPALVRAQQHEPPQNEPVYVGTTACKDCHQALYESYLHGSKKARSSRSVKRMAPKLTAEELRGCFGCHTTGYGRPGGFVSFEKTPELADAGCEVCHGPGSAHVASGGDPARITAKPAMALCETCHNSKRVQDFNFKPMLFAGAH